MRASSLSRPAVTAAAVALIAAPSAAQTLQIGSAAPPLTVREFIKGEPTARFERGKTYVVEFWATWCAPCIQSIPHVSALQKRFPDIKFVGVSVWEDDPARVRPFVERMGEKITYRVALDSVPPGADKHQGAVARAWLDASGTDGIPAAFVVNGEGKIAWMGHSMALDAAILAKVASGKWDQAAALKARQQAAVLRERRDAATQAARERFLAGDLPGALAVIDRALEGAKGGEFADPQMERTLALSRYLYLLRGAGAAGGLDKAAEYGEGLLRRGFYDDAPILLQDIAWQAVDPASPVRPTRRLLRLAVTAAERADKAVGGKHPLFAATLARAHFLGGVRAKAVEAQRRAVRLTPAGAGREREIAVLAEYERQADAGGG